MANWEQIKLKDTCNTKYNTFFVEVKGLGLIPKDGFQIYPIDVSGNTYELYVDNRDEKRQVTFKDYMSTGFEKKQLYMNEPSYDRWGYRTAEKKYINVKPQKYILRVNLYRYSQATKRDDFKTNISTTYVQREIEDIRNIRDLTIWATESEVKHYVHPVYVDINVGDEYYYADKGICTVLEIDHYMCNNGETNCTLKDFDGNEFDINISDPKFSYLPYNYFDELEILDDNLDESYLQPIVNAKKVGTGLINVVWQKLDDAANYTIKMYQYYDVPGMKKLYHLKDYEVDRNCGFLDIDDLVSVEDKIIVVEAENREGDVIAKSRGISVDNGLPQWWTD